MTLIDFIIGFTLMNAMPHFVLGIWRARILGGLGYSPLGNILYGLVNFSVSIGLFAYTYGLPAILEKGIFTGALTVLLLYFFTARFLYYVFHTRHYAAREDSPAVSTTDP